MTTLYPELPEQAKKATQEIMDKFKIEMLKISEQALGELYCDVAVYVEEDSWTNFRNELLDGFCDYNNHKINSSYDFKAIRQSILKEYHDDIIKDLNQDMLEEIKELKKHVEFLQKIRG